MPAYKIITAINIALKYSIRPCPNGCFLSGSFPASFVPTIVIKELATSDKLFTASSTIAIEFDKSPIVVLKITRKIFATIPIILVRTIIFSRNTPSWLVCLISLKVVIIFVYLTINYRLASVPLLI